MKNFVAEPLWQALQELHQQGILPQLPAHLELDRPKQQAFGHLASNVALLLSKSSGKRPRELAEAIAGALPSSPWIEKCELAGPGFLNFFLRPAAFQAAVATVHAEGERYGSMDMGRGERIHLEFVSANPTGPLHVGHGRGAAYGASLANILRFCGYEVFCEYYVNDAGRQMDILAASVFLRYLEVAGQALPWPFPKSAYQGEYVRDIAARFHETAGDVLLHAGEALPALDGMEDGDRMVDVLIAHLKLRLGAETYSRLHAAGLEEILADIRDDLAGFGVHYDNWYPERSLMQGGAVESAIARLVEGGYTYSSGGALWFRSTEFGDDKDRVLRRENGAYTYFASDVAYHWEKFQRGFGKMVDMWGADHHGYIPRVRASLQALGQEDSALEVLLVQFAILYRGEEKISMSTRAGEFVTLRQLREEVGNDAARFFYVLRRADQHLDFDLELATRHSEENPVFYVQYAHARVHSLWRQAGERGLSVPDGAGLPALRTLEDPREFVLADLLWRFPEQVESAAREREPHQIAFYLKELAASFHTYYNATRILVEDEDVRLDRLALCRAVARTLANGLALLGVTAPEQM